VGGAYTWAGSIRGRGRYVGGADSSDSLDELAGEGLELPGGGGGGQQEVQTLPGQHVGQDPQQALGGLGVVRIHRLARAGDTLQLTGLATEGFLRYITMFIPIYCFVTPKEKHVHVAPQLLTSRVRDRVTGSGSQGVRGSGLP